MSKGFYFKTKNKLLLIRLIKEFSFHNHEQERIFFRSIIIQQIDKLTFLEKQMNSVSFLTISIKKIEIRFDKSSSKKENHRTLSINLQIQIK